MKHPPRRPALAQAAPTLYNPFIMLNEARVRQVLAPFGLDLQSCQVEQIVVYLDLLTRWNEKINLTAIRDPDVCLTRHFGESLFLATHAALDGNLLDIGSGAGFPGLALKIAFPGLAVTLLEPVTKKRAFLKEAARVCGFDKVDVRGERLEDFVRTLQTPCFESATSRAVGKLDSLIPLTAKCLKPGGAVFLWLTHELSQALPTLSSDFRWADPLMIPMSRSGEIWRGTKLT